MHRMRWEEGDWTADSDQMILILDSILAMNGEVCVYVKLPGQHTKTVGGLLGDFFGLRLVYT